MPIEKAKSKTILEHQVIGTRPHYLQHRERAQIATRPLERTLVDIDRDTSGSTRFERRITVPAHAAAEIKKVLPLPILRLLRRSPLAKPSTKTQAEKAAVVADSS
jgi:hypothetical protein